MNDSPARRLELLIEGIAKAAERSGRPSSAVTLMAVTKTVPLESVLPFVQAGIRHIGENRVQEALTKYSAHAEAWTVKPAFYLIGPLQSNKAKKAVEFFDMIQSVDRWELARDLNRHAEDQKKVLDCLVQVKISDEPTKSGLDPSLLPELLEKLKGLPALKIRGLMGIPPLAAAPEAARPYFQKLRRLFQAATALMPPAFDTLSMGMSSDFEIAIEEGSTMVRLGTSLFGSRTYP